MLVTVCVVIRVADGLETSKNSVNLKSQWLSEFLLLDNSTCCDYYTKYDRRNYRNCPIFLSVIPRTVMTTMMMMMQAGCTSCRDRATSPCRTAARRVSTATSTAFRRTTSALTGSTRLPTWWPVLHRARRWTTLDVGSRWTLTRPVWRWSTSVR